VTDPDVTVERTRLPAPAELAWAKTHEMMAKKAARANENFMVTRIDRSKIA